MKQAFRAWLAPRMQPTTVDTRFANCGTVERAYGDLDAAFDADQMAAIIDDLTYSASDERSGKPNPSRITINGNIHDGLATLKGAVRLYQSFRQTEGQEIDVEDSGNSVDIPQPIGLERDLQTSLRARIEQLEPGLTIIDGGAERSVESGFIDITARDGSGAIVVIELKAGKARRESVSQVL